MSGRAELNALVKRVCKGNEPDDGKKREVGDALRKHPESASDLWSVFEPHLTSADPSERWLALDCLYDCLSSVKPELPDSALKKIKATVTAIRDDEKEGGKETAERFLDDKALWNKLAGGGGGGGKHGGGDDHDKPGKGGGKHGGHEEHDGPGKGGKGHGHGGDDDDKHGKGGGGGKHGGDDDDKHGKGGGGGKHGGGDHDDDKHRKGGGGGKHGDDDDKHGHGGGGHGKGGKKHGHD